MTPNDRWDSYANQAPERAPYNLLLHALAQFKEPGTAADLGCGTGIETAHLINQGWTVTATDLSTTAIDKTRQRTSSPRLTLHNTGEWWTVDVGTPDLVFAGYSLPFIGVKESWTHLEEILPKGSIVAAHFFGIRDEWSSRDDVDIVDSSMLNSMFNGWTVHYHSEREWDAATVDGQMKHWHVHGIVAGRRWE